MTADRPLLNRETCRRLGSAADARVYKLSAYCTPACARRINLNQPDRTGHSRSVQTSAGATKRTRTQKTDDNQDEMASGNRAYDIAEGSSEPHRSTRRIKVIIYLQERDGRLQRWVVRLRVISPAPRRRRPNWLRDCLIHPTASTETLVHAIT